METCSLAAEWRGHEIKAEMRLYGGLIGARTLNFSLQIDGELVDEKEMPFSERDDAILHGTVEAPVDPHGEHGAKCPSEACGHTNLPEARYCSQCGKVLRRSARVEAYMKRAWVNGVFRIKVDDEEIANDKRRLQ